LSVALWSPSSRAAKTTALRGSTYASNTDHHDFRREVDGVLVSLRGGYALARIREGDDETWVTKSDEYAEPRRNPPDSVVSGRRLDELS
jgi:hypothetical protein